MTLETVDVRIIGTLVGEIWWPYGAECWKDLDYSVTDADARLINGPADLRWHVVRACNDGDFQSAEIADGAVMVERRGVLNGVHVTRKRYFPLGMFPSIEDCRRDDWDGPWYDGEDE